jgi:hypothetical protein
VDARNDLEEVGYKMNRIATALAVIALTATGLTGCTSAADRANENLSKAAENFEVPRRITGINGITDNVLFTVEGFCSYEIVEGAYEVICLVDDNPEKVERTTLAKSDNVTILVTQMGGTEVDLFRPRVIFRPESVIPDFDLSTSSDR